MPITALAAAAMIYAPVFEGMRQSATAGILANAFKRSVTVTGAVSVSLGATIGVQVSGVEIAAPSWTYTGRPQFIDNAEFALPLWPSVTGRPQLTRLALNGAQIDIRLAQKAEPRPAGTVGCGSHSPYGTLPQNHSAISDLRSRRPDGPGPVLSGQEGNHEDEAQHRDSDQHPQERRPPLRLEQGSSEGCEDHRRNIAPRIDQSEQHTRPRATELD